MWSKTRYYMKYSALHLVFPIRFQVISRKIDYLWDSVHCGGVSQLVVAKDWGGYTVLVYM